MIKSRSTAAVLGVEVPSGIEIADRDAAGEAGADYEHELLRGLHGIQPGPAGWPAYEKFCEDLLNFLFVPPLSPAISQSRDEQHANRRDYILPNYTMDSDWWQFMRSHYEAHYEDYSKVLG